MNDRRLYRRLEVASITLLSIIAIALGLLFLDSLSLTVFKITLGVLLLAACLIFWLLRKSINETLRKGKQRFRTAEFKFDKLVESDLIGILISNFEGVVIDANDVFLEMVGYSRQDMENGKILWEEVISEDSKADTAEALEELSVSGYYKPMEKHLERKDSSKFWVLCGSAALQEGETSHIISYVIDISKRKEAEEKAAELQEKVNTQQKEFESIFMNAPAIIAIRRGPELHYAFVNKAVNAIAGPENVDRTLSVIFNESITDQGEVIAQEVHTSGRAVKKAAQKMVFLNEHGEQTVRYLDYMFIPVFNYHGTVDGVAFFGYDVTDLVTAIQELNLSQSKFAFLADTMPHKVWMTNAEGEVQYLNKAYLEYAGIQSGQANAFIWMKTLPAEEVETVRSLWEKCIGEGCEYNYEGRYRRFDGEYRWHLTHAVPFKDVHGTIVYWVGINTDIHDQKMAMERLQNNENYFRDLSEETPFIVWKSDKFGHCIYLNKKWTEITGLSVEESLGKGYRKGLLIDDFEAYRQNWIDTLKTHSLYQDKFRLKTAEGDSRWVFCQANPHYVNNQFDGYIGSIVDVTEQEINNRAIKELSDKKDEFLSIASHELKTPLTSIKASIQLIERSLTGNEKISMFAGKASEQLMRLERLIADLLDVSKINSGKLVYNNTVFYFREMLKEVVQSIQNTTHTHQIIIEHSDKVILLGDRFRLEQVIYNFLSNAIKYSPGADKVIVTSKIKEGYLVVSVQDFGIGIAPENLSKTFDRYYRVDDTAMRFQGLGLGLFISAEIIRRHNGHCWVESEPGKGSTFFFSLPLNDAAPTLKPETDHQTYYKSSQVNIWYNAEKEWIEANWHGFQNFDSFKHGCIEILTLLEINHCSKVLNDNTHVLGSWTDASEWGGKVWLPAMQKAGLRYFAWIHSESTFSRLAEKKIANYSDGSLETRFFEQKQDAIAWLENQDDTADASGTSRAADSSKLP